MLTPLVRLIGPIICELIWSINVSLVSPPTHLPTDLPTYLPTSRPTYLYIHLPIPIHTRARARTHVHPDRQVLGYFRSHTDTCSVDETILMLDQNIILKTDFH